MRKIKSTALLGAFVAVASLGVISHEAHGATIVIPPNNVIPIISKEMLPNSSLTLQASIIPSVGFSNSSITLTISGASFLANDSYTISGANCSASETFATNSLTFNGCTVNAFTAYPVVGPSSTVYFSVSVPKSSSSIVLAYSSSVGDTSTPTTIAQAQQQLTVTPASATTYYINPSSLSIFTNNNYNSNEASNSVLISNNEYGNNSTWSNTINPNIIMSFVFTSIPSSVSSVTANDSGANMSSSSQTPVNGSATVSFTLSDAYTYEAPFQSASSDTLYFNFSNSNNVNIQPGTISLSAISGSTASNSNYVYLSTPQNFLTFTLGGTQIYVPDALAPYGGNAINSGYITISMPSSASIASISVLNVPSASCPTNGILTSTSTPNVYYINLATLASLCTGLSASAWQSGVPLVIYISGSNASPNNITADAYATFNGMLKRIPVNVLNISSVNYSNFSY